MKEYNHPMAGFAEKPGTVLAMAFEPAHGVECNNCKKNVTTVYEATNMNMQTWLCCLVLFLCGCPCISCVPFCVPFFNTRTHSCPECKHEIWKG